MAQGGFNPDNPPEPSLISRITVLASPSDAGNVYGGGTYAVGTEVTIRTTLRSSDYTFKHWLKNGVVYSESMSFTYVMENDIVTFTAVYDFTPQNPSEPDLVLKRKLYLESNTPGACSFNYSNGSEIVVGQTISVRAYANQDYVFKGWYRGNTKLSDQNPMSYTMPDENVTLTAHFEYIFDPSNPGEPQGNQDDVDNRIPGDVNKDRVVTIADVTALVNIIHGKDKVEPYLYDHEAADVNKTDGVTDADVTALVNMILGKNKRRPYQYNRDVVNVEAFEKVTAADVKAEMNTILRE